MEEVLEKLIVIYVIKESLAFLHFKVHYCVHKTLPLNAILRPLIPVCTTFNLKYI